MCILVTGGAGFIGTHLCRALVDQGHKVTCLDNFSTGRKENIKELMRNKRFRLVEDDVENPFFYEIDYIFHLASPASPKQYQKNPVKTLTTNVLGTLNGLECARKANAHFILASTSEIYGDPVEHPQWESYCGNVNPVGVRACYNEGKRCAETLCADYARQYNVITKIVRIFNTYGPYMAIDDGRVISNFIVQALRGDPITIYGTGDQTRSFQYIDDLVQGLLMVMQHKDVLGPLNLGNPEEISIKTIAEKIIAIMRSKSTLTFSQLPQDDPKKRKPDITKAQEILNWKPEVTLEEGLKKTIASFKGRFAKYPQ